MRARLLPALACSVAACANDADPARATPQTVPGDLSSVPATAATTAAATIAVGATSGVVEARGPGGWIRAAPGQVLHLDDAIRTAPRSRADLAMADNAQVTVQENTEISVRELSSTVARLRLDRGRVGADVITEKFTLRVEAKNSSAVAEAQKGSFTVFSDGQGLVAVAATGGKVKVTSAGGDAVLQSGQQAVVEHGRAPQERAIPASVFLKVAWPVQQLTRALETPVHGKVSAGTQVEVNGQPAKVEPDGSFSVTVRLRGGRNVIRVEATDVLGRRMADSSQLEVVRQAPKLRVENKSLWK